MMHQQILYIKKQNNKYMKSKNNPQQIHEFI